MIRTLTVVLYGQPIGVLNLEDDGICAFQYLPEFCEKGIKPAPLMMPTAPDRIYKFPALGKDTFNGLPGMIADSLPDSFGQALLNHWLAAQGRSSEEANAIEKLSFLGNRCMGALEYVPARELRLNESSKIEIDALVNTAQRALSTKEQFQSCLREEEKAIMDILKIGTSAGGQRAKAIIAVNDKTKEIRSGQVKAPAGFDYWILKFDGFDSEGKPVPPASFGRREYAFYKCVTAAGIEMTECRLLEESGRAHFMTRRFDRRGGEKIHMQTLCAISHFDFRRPGAYSYEQAFATMRRLGLGYNAQKEFFRRVVFNILCVNMDDHTKNISFLMDPEGRWSLSPAYDMGFCYNPSGQWANAHQMTIAGKRDGITRKDLLELAEKNDIRDAAGVIDQVDDAVSLFSTFAADARVPENEVKFIMRFIDEKRGEMVGKAFTVK